MVTKDEQISELLTYSMEDIREQNPQRIFEMWVHERREWEEDKSKIAESLKVMTDALDEVREIMPAVVSISKFLELLAKGSGPDAEAARANLDKLGAALEKARS